MTWWLWIILGLVLGAIELATPGGFFVVFFGVGAVAVGLLALTGLAEPAWLQWLLFTVIALVALRLFRRPLLARLKTSDKSDNVDSLVGEAATAVSSLDPGGRGRVELRGAMWNARNVSAEPVAAGQRSRVVAVDGLVLDVRPE